MRFTQVRKPLLVVLGVLGVALLIHLTGTAALALRLVTSLGRLRPDTLAIALLLSVASAQTSGLVWWHLLRKMGHEVPYRAALATYLNSVLAGYVVNVAGPVVGCAASLRRFGVGTGRAVQLTLVANSLGFFGAVAWGPVGLILLSRSGMDRVLPVLGRQGPAVAALALAALWAVSLGSIWALTAAPKVRSRLPRKLRAPLHGDEHDSAQLRFRDTLILLPYSAIGWLVGTLSLYVVLAGINHGVAPSFITVIGASALAAIVGSLAFFAPEGIGVKDGVMVALLSHGTGIPVAACAAAVLAVRAMDPVSKGGLLLALMVMGKVPAPNWTRFARRMPRSRSAVPVIWWSTRRAAALARPGALHIQQELAWASNPGSHSSFRASWSSMIVGR